MMINEVRIHKFGRHENKTIHFTEGVNLITGDNECGKSTLFAFIRASLYGLDGRASENLRKKYTPWRGAESTSPDTVKFGGELIFTQKGIRYRAVSVFTRSKRTDISTLYNDTTGEIINIPDGTTIGEYILELTPGAFDCSVYASQLNSKADYSKDKTGLLITRLSVSSNKSAENSVTEADKRLKAALSAISSPRKGDGVLDRLKKRQDSIREQLVHIEERDRRLSEINATLEMLRKEETEIEKKQNYYQKFTELKKAFAAFDHKRALQQRQEKISRLKDEIDNIRMPYREELYDVPARRSKILVLFAVVLFLLFAALAGFAFYSFQQDLPFYMNIISCTGAVLAFCGALISLIKSKKSLIPDTLAEEDEHQLTILEVQLHEQESALELLLDGRSVEEYIPLWEDAKKTIAASGFSEESLINIRQCSTEVLTEKINSATQALMDIRSKISYQQACADTIQRGSAEGNDADLIEADDIYAELRELQTKIDHFTSKYTALTLARETLEKSFDELQSTFGPVINEKTQNILADLAGITPGALKISKDFAISVYDNETAAYHESSDYSGATEDQMFLAFRFALTGIISPAEANLPLYLDDPFVQYDDIRFTKAAKFLQTFSGENSVQILLATCQSRALTAFEDCHTIKL